MRLEGLSYDEHAPLGVKTVLLRKSEDQRVFDFALDIPAGRGVLPPQGLQEVACISASFGGGPGATQRALSYQSGEISK